MNEPLHSLTSPQVSQLILAAIWACIALSLAVTAFTWWKTVRRWRSTRVALKASAKAQARLAVFDSWVRAGGRTTPLEEAIELQFRHEYADMARRVSEDYYDEFTRYEEEADQELIALILRLKGNVTHE